MCNIVSATSLNGKFLLNCTPYEGDFDNAKKLIIITKEDEKYDTDDFILEKTRSCFSNGKSPWIMLNRNVPEQFLKKGNQIILQ